MHCLLLLQLAMLLRNQQKMNVFSFDSTEMFILIVLMKTATGFT